MFDVNKLYLLQIREKIVTITFNFFHKKTTTKQSQVALFLIFSNTFEEFITRTISIYIYLSTNFEKQLYKFKFAIVQWAQKKMYPSLHIS